MTIEQQIVKRYGLTTNPILGVWMLKDGSLVNGSYEGHQRNVDHREVSYYFKRSKFADPGSSSIYIRKFMNRGNIRWGCGEYGFCIEYTRTPNTDQFREICRYMRIAERQRIETLISHKTNPHHTKRQTFQQWLNHLQRYSANLAELARQESYRIEGDYYEEY